MGDDGGDFILVELDLELIEEGGDRVLEEYFYS